MPEECDHIGHFRIVGGAYIVVRFCTECGKSWRLPTQGDYIGTGLGDCPAAEWEEIKEPREEWISTD